MTVKYVRGSELPLPTPRLDPSANVLYVVCVECGARRSAAWRDKDGRVAVCTVCIERSLDDMLARYRAAKLAAQIAKVEAKKAARRHSSSRHQP